MIPKCIEIENFLSFGTPAVVLRFDDEPLWVLNGPNGVGKSAVFDAITYALFNEHRGGVKDAEKLIRHGANGFWIRFEFEFAGVDYRISRSRAGKTTQRVEQWIDGEWQMLPPSHVKEVNEWVTTTLGLGFDAFTASVLLRQGKADTILTASGKERLDLLKKIIGAEPYEALSRRVQAKTKDLKYRLDDKRTQRDGLLPVLPQELTEAEVALTEAESRRDFAQQQVNQASQNVPLAKQWGALEAQRTDLAAWVHEAEGRAAQAEQIREQAARLADLSPVVPRLREIVRLRNTIAAAKGRLLLSAEEEERMRSERDANLAAAALARQEAESAGRQADEGRREATQLREQIGRDEQYVALAGGIEELSRQLRAFPADLDAKRETASRTLTKLTESEAAFRDAKAEADGLLKQAKARQGKFDEVGVGVPCSQCGQMLDATHARLERNRLADEVRRHGDRLCKAEGSRAAAASSCGEAKQDETRLIDSIRRRDDLSKAVEIKGESLRGLGVSADPATLRDRLNARKTELAGLERSAGERRAGQERAAADAERFTALTQRCETTLSDLLAQIQGAERSLAADSARWDTLVTILPEPWQARLTALGEDEVRALAREQADLASSGVVELAARLRQDDALRAERAKQLSDVVSGIDQIPAYARIPVHEAERAAQEAKALAADADRARDAAKDGREDLARRAERFRALADEILAAERDHDLHKKLDGHLGLSGLQRELVRRAESEIASLANETVRRLSYDDLSIALDGASTDDKALTLRVSRAGDPTPIDAAYLSGSQKFRVAVALALAIGRHAGGQARPIESVIIDEGFGSLDRDGLHAAAEEFNNLSRHLRRVLLVSHQEEFAERFPVRYRLSPGDNGTTAERVRH